MEPLSVLLRGQVHSVWRATHLQRKRAGKLSATNRNSTSAGERKKERIRREDDLENPIETSGKPVAATHIVTCKDEYLLKACASGQEKLSFCNKNCAAGNAHIAHPRGISSRGEKKIAWPAHLHALTQVHAHFRRNRPASDKVSDRATRCRACGRIFTAIELHARPPFRGVLALVRFRCQHIEPPRSPLAQPGSRFLLIHLETLQRGLRAKHNNGKGRPG